MGFRIDDSAREKTLRNVGIPRVFFVAGAGSEPHISNPGPGDSCLPGSNPSPEAEDDGSVAIDSMSTFGL